MPKQALLVTRHFPQEGVAGNLTYLNAIVEFLEGQPDIDLHLLVLGDRFPDNEFVYRYGSGGSGGSGSGSGSGGSQASRRQRLQATTFASGQRAGGWMVLTDPKALLKNAARRAAFALPARLTNAISDWYFSAKSAGPEDRFAPLPDRYIARATREIAALRPTFLFVDTIQLTPVLRAASLPEGSRSFLVMHDLMHERLRSLRQQAGQLPRYQARFLEETDLEEVEREEMRRMALFDGVLAIQQEEADHVAERFPEKQVFYVPMPRRARVATREGDPLTKRCLFVGSRGGPNEQGVQWFLRQVWPRLRERVPGMRFDVCGTCCDNLDAGGAPGVHLHGRVPDLDPFYRQADAFVVPLRAGSGMKVKLADAMAAGCACVTTPVGMQGFSREGIGSAFLRADSAEEFARAVARIATDRGCRDDLRAAAARFVEAHLSPEAAFAGLRDALAADASAAGHALPKRHASPA